MTAPTTRTVITINIATQYTYKEISTLENAYKVHIPNVPLFKKTVATVHTHPMGSGKGITKFSDEDIDNANDRMIPSYVYGPNGELQKYNPANGTITVFFGLPKSPYTPWLELYNLGGG